MKHSKNHKGLIVFYSYASADEDLRNRLAKHLIQLKHEGLISEWYDQQILAGSDRAQAIDQAIHSAYLILLLISADFLASDTCDFPHIMAKNVKHILAVTLGQKPVYSKQALKEFAGYCGSSASSMMRGENEGIPK